MTDKIVFPANHDPESVAVWYLLLRHEYFNYAGYERNGIYITYKHYIYTSHLHGEEENIPNLSMTVQYSLTPLTTEYHPVLVFFLIFIHHHLFQ